MLAGKVANNFFHKQFICQAGGIFDQSNQSVAACQMSRESQMVIFTRHNMLPNKVIKITYLSDGQCLFAATSRLL